MAGFPWGSVISAGAQLAGAGLGFLGAERANQSSAASVERQIAFQERAYKNRYQWQMADMRKAGLNPILSSMGGAGLSPQGASMTYRNIGAPAAEGVRGAVSSALAARRLRADEENIKAQAEKGREGAATERSTRMVQGWQLRNLQMDYDLKEQQMFSAVAQARRQREMEEIYKSSSFKKALMIGEHWRAAAAGNYVPAFAAGAGAGALMGRFRKSGRGVGVRPGGYEPQSPKEAWKRRQRSKKR